METSQTSSGTPGHALRLKCIAVGGAGLNFLSQTHPELAGMDLLAVHTSARALQQSATPQQALLGTRRLHGLGTGGDPELGRAAAEDEFGQLQKFCTDADLIFLVAGMGGGTGSGASAVVARAAKEAGALVIAFVIQPFEFEGPRRVRQAQAGLSQLRAVADAVVCLPNQKLFKILEGQSTLLESFSVSNKLLLQGVKGMARMVSAPGLIKVDFAYLYSLIRGSHAESTFATAETQGTDKAVQVISALMQNPLLEGEVLTHSDVVLVSLCGGHDLAMSEVSYITNHFNQLVKGGQVIIGAAVDASMQGKLGLTVIASRRRPLGAGRVSHLASTSGTESSSGKQDSSAAEELENPFLQAGSSQRPRSRFVPPAPPSSAQRTQEVLKLGNMERSRKSSKMRQGQLPLEIISKGRFEKVEPTIHHGEDLDVPTYIRRGLSLN